MNIFFIPSWYPSTDSPISGIFSKEQAEQLAKAIPDINIGISIWGQKSESNLLWLKDGLRNVPKILRYSRQKYFTERRKDNLYEYYTPALTWTTNIFDGNLKNITEANEQNLRRFEQEFGKATLIHAHVAFPAGYIAMKLAEKFSLPFIITEQMSPFPLTAYQHRSSILSKINTAIQKANCVISISPHSAADIRRETGVKAVIIPNLVDDELFAPPTYTSVSPPFKFFTLGRLVPQKGIADLLVAISLLRDKDTVFRIGGNANNLEYYKRLAIKLKVNDRVIWLGELSRTEAVFEFQNCNAFVLPSLHESMGVVYAEALGCGKPIIATRCGGPEYIVKDENGILVERGSPKQLAEAMTRMIKYYSNYNQKIIREDFLNRFSSKVITSKIYEIYKAVASGQPIPPGLFHID